MGRLARARAQHAAVGARGWCPARYSAPHDGHHTSVRPRRGSVRGCRRYDGGNARPTSTTRTSELLRRDARLPEERRRLRQGRRLAARRRADVRRLRAADADLVVVNTCAFIEAARQESIDVALALADTSASRGAGSSSPAAWPSATATSSRPRCPKPTRWSGSRARASLVDVVMRGPQARRRARPARAAAARAERAVGVREGRRGLRPRVRVLRDPVVPRQATLAHAGVDRGRGARARRAGRRRDRARRAGPRLVRPRRRRAGFARAAAAPARPARAARARARPPALPLPVRGARTRSSRTMLELRSVVPYFDLSLQHAAPGLLRSMKRWGSGDRFAHDHRRHPRAASPTPRSARRSSSASRARPKSDHDALLGFLDDVRLDWAGFFAFSQRRRHRGRRTIGRRGRRLARARAPARMCRGAGADHRRGARSRSSGATIDVLVDGIDDDGVLVGRTHREAPEIDGVVRLVGTRRRCSPARARSCARPCAASRVPISTPRSAP